MLQFTGLPMRLTIQSEAASCGIIYGMPCVRNAKNVDTDACLSVNYCKYNKHQ